MGCCESAPEVTSIDEVVTEEEKGVTRIEEAKDTLTINEQDAVKAKADNDTFIGTVLKAREAAADNPEVMKDACTRLQAHNRRLKEYIAIYDSQTVKRVCSALFSRAPPARPPRSRRARSPLALAASALAWRPCT